jgi:hypothetical protein
MGANAVTTVPVYVAGEVLTASDMNITNSGVPVFATTTTRDAAFGGTGEKTLAEGQMAYIENIAGSAAVQYYDGAAWATLVTSGLTFLASAAPSAVASVSINNCFSATYQNYLIIFRLDRSAAGQLGARYRVSGTDASGANYNSQIVFAAGTGAGGITNTAQTSATVLGDAGGGDTNMGMLVVSNPAAAVPTYFTSNASYAGSTVALAGSAYHNVSTAYDGITFFPAAGTITGTIRVYGYANS